MAADAPRVRKGETFKCDGSIAAHCMMHHTACWHRGETKKKDVRITNIEAAKALADAVRTSLGPRGMDKMVCGG